MREYNKHTHQRKEFLTIFFFKKTKFSRKFFIFAKMDENFAKIFWNFCESFVFAKIKKSYSSKPFSALFVSARQRSTIIYTNVNDSKIMTLRAPSLNVSWGVKESCSQNTRGVFQNNVKTIVKLDTVYFSEFLSFNYFFIFDF